MIQDHVFQLVKKFEQNRQELLRRHNLEAKSVTMHPDTLKLLISAYPLDLRTVAYAADYFRGVKVFKSVDVPRETFYFSHQL